MSCSGKMMINDYQESFGALFFCVGDSDTIAVRIKEAHKW